MQHFAKCVHLPCSNDHLLKNRQDPPWAMNRAWKEREVA